MRQAIGILAALATLWAGAAGALTVDQVIRLKKAGVSETVIQQMIDTEMKVAAQGGLGTYTKRLESGREVIVYQAVTPRGVVEYPLPEWDRSAGGVDPRGVVLGVERRDRPSQALGGSHGRTVKGYALHLMSFQDQARADRAAAKLAAKGVTARVAPVDLGEKGRWYRVLVGDYPDRARAEAGGAALKKAGNLDSYRVIAQ